MSDGARTPEGVPPIGGAPRRVAIACQGGGSHTAFTAGVLSRLLDGDELALGRETDLGRIARVDRGDGRRGDRLGAGLADGLAPEVRDDLLLRLGGGIAEGEARFGHVGDRREGDDRLDPGALGQRALARGAEGLEVVSLRHDLRPAGKATAVDVLLHARTWGGA